MRGYYFTDSKMREKLFVPYNLIVTEEMKKEGLNVNLDPNVISKPGVYLRRNRISLERGLIALVDVPDCFLEGLREACFGEERDSKEEWIKVIFRMVQEHWKKMQIFRG